jgi:hypothetical protein
MRKSLGLTFVLRSAVLQALALGACVAPTASCGGAVEALTTPGDAGKGLETGIPMDSGHTLHDAGGDAATPPDDAGRDVSTPPDDAGFDVTEFDVQDDVLDSSFPEDVHPDDAGCVPLGPPVTCGVVPYSCIPSGMVVGQNSGSACNEPCGVNNFGSCMVFVADGGAVSVECLCGGGRFPEGLEVVGRGAGGGGDRLGLVLARNAALEAAAVSSFEQLARELAWHGAPDSLVARARRAARQEVTHARLLRRAAAARGCAVPRTRARPAAVAARTLLDIARENAVEGCGREALGAALLQFQSRRCPDPELTAVLTRIAADETGHAELSWHLHVWLLSRLDADERAEVLAAHEAFLDRCEESAPPELADADLAASLGMPTRRQWRVLVSAVRWGLRGVGAALRAA